MIAFKNLVIGIAANLQIAVYKPFMEGKIDRPEVNIQAFVIEDSLQTVGLRYVARKYIIGEAEVLIVHQVLGQHIKVFVKDRLMNGLKGH